MTSVQDRTTEAGTHQAGTHQGGKPRQTTGRSCERAVITAYRDLRTRGTGDREAFETCTTLYRIHHPESSLAEARILVSEWIDHHLLQRTPTAPACPYE